MIKPNDNLDIFTYAHTIGVSTESTPVAPLNRPKMYLVTYTKWFSDLNKWLTIFSSSYEDEKEAIKWASIKKTEGCAHVNVVVVPETMNE